MLMAQNLGGLFRGREKQNLEEQVELSSNKSVACRDMCIRLLLIRSK
jgi:hypothetical protein